MDINLPEMSASRERRRYPRRATIAVLIEQLSLAQRVGQWLGNETHGDAYCEVRELNEYLHQAQRKLRDIQNNPAMSAKRTAGGMDLIFEYRPT